MKQLHYDEETAILAAKLAIERMTGIGEELALKDSKAVPQSS